MQHTHTGSVVRYAGYDKVTGRIVHTHSRFSVAENRFVEMPIEELKARFSTDAYIVARLSGRNPDNLDFIKVEGSIESGPGREALMVDPSQRRLVPRPELHLRTQKQHISGDGKDSTEIEVFATDSTGRTIADAHGKVKVTTTRGKLSAHGGLVELVHGRATLTLTSVNETVSAVHLTATPLNRPYAPAALDIEFV